MKKILTIFGVLGSVAAIGSISAYSLYILPKQQEERLIFEKEKWNAEQEEKRMQKIEKEVENEQIKADKIKEAYDQKIERYRAQCSKNKEFGVKQMQEMFNECTSDICVNNLRNSVFWIKPDFIQVCIDRKLKGLSTGDS